MLPPPLISVIMCTYNGAPFLNEQIQSILNQDYKHIELIIVDDASTDNTWALLLAWQAKSRVIKIERNAANVGYNKNFAYALTLATGNFIAFADQDDIWMPQKLSKTLGAFTNDQVMLAHCKSVRLQEGILKYNLAALHHHFSGSDTRRLFFFNQVTGHDAMIKKELVPYILPIPPGMMYDWWTAVVATCYGTIASIDEILAHHRIHTNNSFFTSKTNSKPKQLDIEDSCRLFLTIPALHDDNRQYLLRFLDKLSTHNKRKKAGFDFAFFTFLYANRKIIFGHKKRLLPELNYFKNSLKYAGKVYKGKGLSV